MTAGDLERSIQALRAHVALLDLRATEPEADHRALLRLAMEDLHLAVATIAQLAEQRDDAERLPSDDLGTARLRRLAGSVEALHLTDGQGRLLSANAAAVRLLGYDSPDEMRASVLDATALYQQPSLAELLTGLQDAGGIRGYLYEGQLRTRAGTPLPVRCHIRLLHNPAGAVVGIDALWQPIEGSSQ